MPRSRSTRVIARGCFNLALTSTQLAKKGLTRAEAVAIFERLADDPTPTDWVARPLDCLAVLTTPHHAAFEQWFEASRERELETALEVAELRPPPSVLQRTAVRRALARAALATGIAQRLRSTTAARLQRQDLQSRYPAYVELGKRAAAVARTAQGSCRSCQTRRMPTRFVSRRSCFRI